MVPSIDEADVLQKKCKKCGRKLVVGKIVDGGDGVVATELKCKHCNESFWDLKFPVEQLGSDDGEGGISEAEVCLPLAEFVEPDDKPADVHDMGKYSDVFFSIEYVVLSLWKSNPKMKDKEVIKALRILQENFDNHEGGSVADELAKSVKAMLVMRRKKGKRRYTKGEIISCVALLEGIAKEHENSKGDGYLRWVRTFFEGKLPETEEEMFEYAVENET